MSFFGEGVWDDDVLVTVSGKYVVEMAGNKDVEGREGVIGER